MNSLYNKYKKLLDINNISSYKVSKDTGISTSTLSEFKSGKINIKLDKLQILANYFKVPISYFLDESDNIPASKKRGVKIPVLGKVQAGVPLNAIEDIIDYEEIPEDWTKQGEFFALQINGDSMEPKFSTGDVVIVRKQSSVDNGQIAIVLIDNQDATCKKVLKKNTGITLVSTNPKYSPMYFNHDEINYLPVTILGRVVELRAKF